MSPTNPVTSFLLSEEDRDDQGVSLLAVGQIFSPLFASYQVLLNTGNAYSTISTENGTTYVFHQFGEVTCVALCGDGEEDEDFLRRKALAFQSFVGFFFGPVAEELKPSTVSERNSRWKFLSNLLQNWSELTKTDQAFLAEATEQLLVRNELNADCIKMLEEALKTISRLEDITAVHGLLLIGTKLLALFSSRAAVELNPSDTLIIIILACTTFPPVRPREATPPPEEDEPDEYRQPVFEPPRPDTEVFTIDVLERFELDSKDIFYSPVATPVLAEQAVFPFPRFSTPGLPTPNASSSRLADGSESSFSDFKSISEVVDDQITSADPEVESYLLPKVQSLPAFKQDHYSEAGRRSARRGSLPAVKEDHEETDREEEGPVKEEGGRTFVRHKVFLKTTNCPHTPYVLHCIEIMRGIVLAVVSEIPTSSISIQIHQMLFFLSSLRNVVDAAQGKELGRIPAKSAVHNVLEDSQRKIVESARRHRKGKGFKTSEKICKDLPSKWESLKEKGLQSFLETIETDTALQPKTANADLENGASNVVKLLHIHFKDLYFDKRPAKFSTTDGLCVERVRHLFSSLNDQKDFLAAKALRNVPAIRYQLDFPGLVYFIYVDRMTNQVTAPSLDVADAAAAAALEGTQSDPLKRNLKENIWSRRNTFRRLLAQGYMSGSIRDSRFLYSYQLWCEDQTGSVLSWDSSSSLFRDVRPPSVISVKFFKDLMGMGAWKGQPGGGGAVHCYEMMCVHVGVVSTEHAAKQARKLANLLWDASAVNIPTNLL